MATAQKLKASEKQALGRKLVTRLKKEYRGSVPQEARSVRDTLLFAICLENASREDAEAAFRRLHELFHDLNEVRVSSISELSEAFQGMSDPEWKALRVRSLLQHVFEQTFDFDFEPLRRKTHEQAAKQLERIRDLTPFVREYVLHEALDTHVVPMDDALRRAGAWLGLIPPDHNAEQASEDLKTSLRKADASTFCHYLRCLATDPRFAREFQQVDRNPPKVGYDPGTAVDRLSDLLTATAAKPKNTAAKASRGKTTAGKSSGNRKKKKPTRSPAASPRRKK